MTIAFVSILCAFVAVAVAFYSLGFIRGFIAYRRKIVIQLPAPWLQPGDGKGTGNDDVATPQPAPLSPGTEPTASHEDQAG